MGYGYRPTMKSSTKWFLGILGLLVLIGLTASAIFFFTVVSFVDGEDEDLGATGGREKLGLIELSGPIIDSEKIVKQFKKLRDRKDVRAIVFRVESPGGGVAASQEIYEEVKATQRRGIPVIVSMGAVAASGGYYVSAPAKRIVANPGTLTGSIGVISQFLRYDPMLAKLGIEATTIKSGKMKDAGNPLREMSKEDKQYFQALMDNVHRQFIGVVSRERGLDSVSVKAYADGRVFTGEEAFAMGLVDTLGTYEDAKRIAAEMVGITGEPGIVKERRTRPLMERLFGEAKVLEFLGLKEYILHQSVLQYKLIFP